MLYIIPSKIDISFYIIIKIIFANGIFSMILRCTNDTFTYIFLYPIRK